MFVFIIFVLFMVFRHPIILYRILKYTAQHPLDAANKLKNVWPLLSMIAYSVWKVIKFILVIVLEVAGDVFSRWFGASGENNNPDSCAGAPKKVRKQNNWELRRNDSANFSTFNGQRVRGGMLPKHGSWGGYFDYRVDNGTNIMVAGTRGTVNLWKVTGDGNAQIFFNKGIDRSQHEFRGNVIDYYTNSH